MTEGYLGKVIEGVRRLWEIAAVAYKKEDLRRAALTSKKDAPGADPLWRYPMGFMMEEPSGYRRRVVSPKMEESVTKGCFHSLTRRIVGVAMGGKQFDKKGNVAGEAVGANSIDADGPDENDIGASKEKENRTCPDGKRNSGQVRSLAIRNAPANKAGVEV